MDADGSNPVQLTTNGVRTSTPDWSPDGQKIVYYRSFGGNNEIFVMDADGQNQTQLTNALGDDKNPQYSPDGSR